MSEVGKRAEATLIRPERRVVFLRQDEDEAKGTVWAKVVALLVIWDPWKASGSVVSARVVMVEYSDVDRAGFNKGFDPESESGVRRMYWGKVVSRPSLR